MANATRYSTEELADLETRIASAADRALALELEQFEALVATVLLDAETIAKTARSLARLDVAAGFAELAEEQHYTRPAIDDGEGFVIESGRHPVVEQALFREQTPFIANDADLTEASRLWLLTGPNMAGKSTFLRQNALITVLAQAGSFVPAERAEIGTVDRLFSRVGAADELARGRSTFMVEMVETAAILNQATARRAWSSSTRSGAAPRPMTGSRSPGPWSSICTRPCRSAAGCSRPTITSSPHSPPSSTASPAGR